MAPFFAELQKEAKSAQLIVSPDITRMHICPRLMASSPA
jgi:hypothetical protein